MPEEDISQKGRLQKLKEINNYFYKEIDQNELSNNKNKKVFTTLNYKENFPNLVFAVTVYISAFASLILISKGLMSSTMGLNICAITTTIKKYKSMIKKKKKKYDEKALLAKTNLDSTKDLISNSKILNF